VSDHQGAWPDNFGNAAVLEKMSGGEVPQSLNPNGATFATNPWLSGVRLEDVEQESLSVMIFETKAWPDGKITVAFTDSTVRRIGVDELVLRLRPRVKAKLRSEDSGLGEGRRDHP
jgi:hypothetical protein